MSAGWFIFCLICIAIVGPAAPKGVGVIALVLLLAIDNAAEMVLAALKRKRP